MNIKTHPTLWVCGVFSVQTTPKELMQYTCSMFMRGRCKLSSVFVFVFEFVTASVFVHKHVNCSTQCSSVLVIKCQLMVAVQLVQAVQHQEHQTEGGSKLVARMKTRLGGFIVLGMMLRFDLWTLCPPRGLDQMKKTNWSVLNSRVPDYPRIKSVFDWIVLCGIIVIMYNSHIGALLNCSKGSFLVHCCTVSPCW